PLQIGGSALTTYNRIGTGTTTHALNLTSDLLVSGNLEVQGNLYAPLTGVSGYFQRNNNALAPTSITDDLLLGSTATASSRFAFINVGGGTPTASISGATGATSLTATGVLGTTNKQTLQIGTPNTGNINISQAGATTTINGTTVLSALNSFGVVHTDTTG